MVAVSQRTLSKAIEAYLRELRQRDRAIKTQQQRRYILERFNNFLKREAKVIYPTQLTLHDARAFITQLSGNVTRYASHSIYRPRLDERYSTHTLRTYVSTLRTFSRWLKQQKYCREPVLATLEMPTLSLSASPPLSQSDWLRMLNSVNRKTVRGMRLYAIIVLLTDGGLSPHELVNLRIGDWDGQCVVIRKPNQTRRLVPLSVESQKGIATYLKNARPLSKSDHLILNETGAPLTTNALTQILRRLAKRCEVEKLSARSLRQFGVPGSLSQPNG